MNSLRMTTLAILALVSACASEICKVPTANISEGCVQCFTYSIEKVPSDVLVTTTRMPTIDDCKNRFGLGIYNHLISQLGWDDATFFGTLCSGLQPITQQTYAEKDVCIVSDAAVHSKCIPQDEEVFTVQTPRKQDSGNYPANIVCFWNTPSTALSQKVYVDTLRMNVQGNPTRNCYDKLVVQSGTSGTDQVSCGDTPIFYNSLSNTKVEPIFISDGSIEASGVELLLVYLNSPVPVPGITSTGSDVFIDLNAQPTPYNTLRDVCKCKPINITRLCSPDSLDDNIYYQKYLTIADQLPLNGEYGFLGYKGCVGVDFFGCDGVAKNVTDLDCSTFTLGMTPAEADRFLTEGASMWGLASSSKQDTAFCNDAVSSTSPNAQEHIQIQDLVLRPNEEKAMACSTSANPVLKKVATQLKNNGSIPAMC